MLWPISEQPRPGKALSMSAARARARRFTPAIGGTRVSVHAVPRGAQKGGNASEIRRQGQRPRPIRS